jgi:hypothetical protein
MSGDWTQHPGTHHLYEQWCLPVSAVGVASRYVTSTTAARNSYLFGAIGTVLEQLTEKPLHFCKDFSSLIYVWSVGGYRTRYPLPRSTTHPVSDVTRQTIS